MHEHSDWFNFFAGFWWLIFPIFSLLWGLADQWSRHNRAKQGLEIIRAYVDQGKDPPPELVKALQQPGSLRRKDRGQTGKWVPFCLFTALGLGFVMMAFSHIGQGDGDKDAMPAILFVAMVMGGLAIGFLAAIIAGRKAGRDGEQTK